MSVFFYTGFDEAGRRESSRGKMVMYNNIGQRTNLQHNFKGRKDLEERIESVQCDCPRNGIGGVGGSGGFNGGSIGGSGGFYGRPTTRRPSFNNNYPGSNSVGGSGSYGGGYGGGYYGRPTTRRPYRSGWYSK